jgi:DNA-binding NtrC family response regulator
MSIGNRSRDYGREFGRLLKRSFSEAMRQIEQTAIHVAPTNVSIVIFGEQGTGKERLARTIHSLSLRAASGLVTVDCSALPPEHLEQELFGFEEISWEGINLQKGAIEEAHKGTLLLDEFQAVSRAYQAKIARIFEYGYFVKSGSRRQSPIDVRLIMTITRRGENSASAPGLLEDLQHRLSPIIIEIPALRHRSEDIPMLIRRFVEEFEAKGNTPIKAIAQDTITTCLEYDWPGNVRHLKNAIEYACVMSGGSTIRPEHLPNYVAKAKEKC